MAPVTGVFNSGQLAADLAQKSFAGLITRIMPNGSAPLFAMTALMKTEIAVQTEHGYFSKTMVFPNTTSTAGDLVGATTLTVVATASFLPGMILLNTVTNEQILVLTVPSATTITVRRAVGTTVAAALTAADPLIMIGTAFEESSVRPTAFQITAVRNSNLTQIFRNTWAVSDTMRQTMVIAGDTNVAESKQDCAAMHAADIEKALFFGEKYSNTLNGQPLRKMEGLIANTTINAPANVTTLGATTNLTQLEAAVDPVFDQTTDPKGSNERVLFVGGGARKVINNIGKLNGTYQLQDGQTSFGLQFSSVKLARGTLKVIEHPLFNAYGNLSAMYKMGVVVDLPSFSLAYLGDRKTQHKAFNDQTANAGYAVDQGIDATGGTLTTECTALFKNPAANAVLKNFTAAAAG